MIAAPGGREPHEAFHHFDADRAGLYRTRPAAPALAVKSWLSYSSNT